AFLTEYQDAGWAARYRERVERVRECDARLADAVARSLFKLMAYKDEYEVARLFTETGFVERLAARFEGPYTVKHHLAPPFLPGRRDARGRPKKRVFGGWVRGPMRLLARMKGLRGTVFDPFGYTAERRMEREMIALYERVVDRMLEAPGDAEEMLRIARLPQGVRGFGPVKEDAAREAMAAFEAFLEAPAPKVLRKAG
ncbi:MAG: DUF6537 domain-containing protein, partial [Pseudomonadota bacterium]